MMKLSLLATNLDIMFYQLIAHASLDYTGFDFVARVCMYSIASIHFLCYYYSLLCYPVMLTFLAFFSVDYKFLGIMKRQFPEVPLLGLTATATVKVLEDVKSILHVPECLLFKSSFNRPNLYYQVRRFTVISAVIQFLYSM